jgi:hypothetical protein
MEKKMEDKKQEEVLRVPLSESNDETVNFQEIYSDSTNLIDVSLMENDGFSSELLQNSNDCYDIEQVVELRKGGNNEACRTEGERQVKALEKSRHGLNMYNAKYGCIILYQQGVLMEEVEKSFEKKGEFTEWRGGKFQNQHLRTLQHAQKLAKMGPGVLRYAAIGVARMLALATVKNKTEGLDLKAIEQKHPFPDLSEDENGNLFSEHADSIITLYRLQTDGKKAELKGIPFVTFDQAALIAAIKKEAIKVRDADSLKRVISDEANKPAFFERYLLNKAVLNNKPSEEKIFSLDSLLGEFLSNCTDEKLDDEAWIESHKAKFTESTIVAAYKRILNVAQKFNVTLEDNQNSTESKETI